MVGRASDKCQEWLEEAETNRDKSNDDMGVGVDGLGDVPQLQDDEDEAGHGETPGEHHEVAVPDEPLVKIVTLVRRPGLFEVSDKMNVSVSIFFVTVPLKFFVTWPL